MNAKFFDVKKEKQDSVINAALKVFTQYGYKKASTDVIVKEAGISKGLLFHYFDSKKGTYAFIYEYSIRYMTMELMQTVKKSEKDFFEVQRMIEQAKTVVMKNYPYMQQFLSSTKFETHPDAVEAIGDKKNVLQDVYNQIYKQADMTRFADQIDVMRVINMINWMSQGFIRDKFNEPDQDLDAMNEEFGKYLSMLRDHFYNVRSNSSSIGISIASESSMPGISLMDSMRETTNENTESLNSAAADASYTGEINASYQGAIGYPTPNTVEDTSGYMSQPSAETYTEEPVQSSYSSGSFLGSLLRGASVAEASDNKKKEEYIPELSFEERLAAGKRPLVDIPVSENKDEPEEPKEEVAEDTPINQETDNLSAESDAAIPNAAVMYDTEISGGAEAIPEISASETTVPEMISPENAGDYIEYPSLNPASEREVRQITPPEKTIPVYSNNIRPMFAGQQGNGNIGSAISEAPKSQPVQGGYKVQRRTFAEMASEVISEEDREDDLSMMGPAPILPEYHAPAPKNPDDYPNDDGNPPLYYPLKF